MLGAEAEADVLLGVVAAPEETATVSGKLLPRTSTVLLRTNEEELHVVAETYLRQQKE